jgi:hypothetical protein
VSDFAQTVKQQADIVKVLKGCILTGISLAFLSNFF